MLIAVELTHFILSSCSLPELQLHLCVGSFVFPDEFGVLERLDLQNKQKLNQ